MPSVGPVSAVAGILTALLCGFLYPINPTACKLVGYLGERLPAEFIAPVAESLAYSPETGSCARLVLNSCARPIPLWPAVALVLLISSWNGWQRCLDALVWKTQSFGHHVRRKGQCGESRQCGDDAALQNKDVLLL